MPISTIPTVLPLEYVSKPGQQPAVIVDTGGYDFMVGGQGFRLATDQTFPYVRQTEPTTVQRFDSNQDPGEQSLSPLPWIKSQESWHGGAGQLNLEHGRSTFQYQQEQIDHIRFDNCIGVDVWTPGTVVRLPDTQFFNFGFTSSCMVTATVGGIDYAIIGGNGNLYQAAWLAGPDAPPTVTAISLTDPTYGGAANCNITSLATDGVHYYGVLQLTTVGSVPGILTYFISGSITSVAMPTPIYDVPGVGSASARTNLCTNPNFETSAASWAARSTGGNPVTLAQSATQFHGGSKSCLTTATGSSAFKEGAVHTFTTVNGLTYTASAWVWVAAGSPAVLAFQVGGTNGTSTSGTGSWQRISVTFTATGSPTQVCFGFTPTASGQLFYVDDVLIEVGAVVGTYFDGSTATDGSYTYAWSGTANLSTSNAVPVAVGGQALGIAGWAKARLVGCIAGKLYELDANATAHTALPTPRYSHPVANWLWTAITEAPTGIYAAGYVGGQSSILSFTLDTSGGTPFLSGGVTVAQFPAGELVLSMGEVIGSFLSIGSTRGIRIGTFDTYTGALVLNPPSVTTSKPVLALATRDRFVYGSYTNQQADGKTGLVRLDLSMVTDTAGRNAYAPDLRPPTTAPTGLGAVTGLAILPSANRIVFVTPEGIHVEGNGPGSDGAAWLRTSRIRYDTAEMKLFKRGRLHGSLSNAEIQITGITPFGVSDQNLGTYGFLTGTDDPGEFLLPAGLHEWIQLQFALIGSSVSLDSYQVKALPAPKRQHIIQVTGSCFTDEIDRFGLEVTDPVQPRQRYQNVLDMEAVGDEVTFVEFTNFGAVSEAVVIDQIQYQSFARPTIEDDFGGWITFKLRSTA